MVICYVDSSAALKRVLIEENTVAVNAEFVDGVEQGHAFVTSSLTWVEISRALMRRPAESVRSFDRAFRDALHGIARAPITESIVEIARTLGPTSLRSLDAIHLGTAVVLGAHEVWTYDHRIAEASRTVGIAVREAGSSQ